MMRYFTLLASLIGATILLGCSGVGEPVPGIFGKVIEKRTGQPIANATVTLFRDGSDEIATAKTAENGSFAFPGVSPGSYTLVISTEGYLEGRIEVTLKVGQRLSVPVELYSVQEGPPTDVPIID